ncbi:MAG: HAD family hydrolase [Candidatus Thorarchaeota archaeon]
MRVKAILFDLHETITETSEDILSLTRRVSHLAGFDLSEFSDEEIEIALEKVIEYFNPYQIENDVDIHFGGEVEHWTGANKIMYESLGFEDLSVEALNNLEEIWKGELKTWEFLRLDAEKTLYELHKRGYILGICTRRADDPTELLRNWAILDLMSTVQWTSVPGYSKPSPYTLIMAADEIGVNPLRCAYVGNSAEADIEAANRAGMIAVLATWANPEEANRAPKGIHIINEIPELLDLFSI